MHQGLFPGSVQGLYCTGWVEDYTYAELLANCRLRNGEIIPRVADALEFIYTRTNLPTWLDSKSPDVIVPVSAILADLQKKLVSCNPPPPGGLQEGQRCLFPGSAPVWERGIIALPSADFVTEYKRALAAGQLAPNQHCLVEEDPAAAHQHSLRRLEAALHARPARRTRCSRSSSRGSSPATGPSTTWARWTPSSPREFRTGSSPIVSGS